MSDGLLHGLKKVMEEALAFEPSDHRDSKVIPIQGPPPSKALSPQPITRFEGRK